MKFKYRHIISFVSITIFVTISIQIYWNVIHYRANKVAFSNQVQSSLNNAVESYYANMAKSHVIKFISSDTDSVAWSNLEVEHQSTSIEKLDFDSSKNRVNFIIADSIDVDNELIQEFVIKRHRIDDLAQKIVISIENDSIELQEVEKLLQSDFDAKNWNLDFALMEHTLAEENSISKMRSVGLSNLSHPYLSANAESTYLPESNRLEIRFSNILSILLYKSLFGISISFLLSIAIIFCLLFLLRIIRDQKQLSEIKNDLISNITHEFKTPITTISTALQGIESFNDEEDKVKTKKYLAMSHQQVEKLNVMVEKLLETATLDSEQLNIRKEDTNIALLIEQVCSKHKLLEKDSKIELKLNQDLPDSMVDPFHFENAISNIVDNAMKYGGDLIQIALQPEGSGYSISIRDNGEGIEKAQQSLIFEKFYRVPKGNLHDVKGFGIGLYYSKTIVEKHDGILSLKSDADATTFKIVMHA